MVDFSANDGHFKISQGSCFSKSIVKELGLNPEDTKKMGSIWSKIFAIAERENMGNLDLVVTGQEFKFSETGWKEIVDLVNEKLGKNIQPASTKPESDPEPEVKTPPAPPASSSESVSSINLSPIVNPLFEDTTTVFVNESTAVARPILDQRNLTALPELNLENRPENWDNIKSKQDAINLLPTNKERVIAWNKEFSKDGKPYVIVDKENFTATVYSSSGEVLKEFEVGLGKKNGDALRISGNGQVNNFTTAGIYTAKYKGSGTDDYSRLYNANILTLSNDALKERGIGSGETGVALHQVPNGNSARIEALQKEGVSIENNRFSDGCVNFLPEEFEELMTYIEGVGTKVYILPEDDNNYMCVKNGELQFAQKEYTGDVPTTSTTHDSVMPIEIAVNSDLSEEGKNMAQALCDYKQKLCKDLKLDNDTYNELALLALGIAGQETNYGDPLAGSSKGTPYFLKEELTGLFNFLKEDIMGNNSYNSRGLTQMKIAGYTDETVKAMFKKYDITPDNVKNGEKSALATMIVLNSMLKNELPSLRTKMAENGVSTQDALLYCWNNKKNEIRNGTATPEKNIYIKNVRNFMNGFDLTQRA